MGAKKKKKKKARLNRQAENSWSLRVHSKRDTLLLSLPQDSPTLRNLPQTLPLIQLFPDLISNASFLYRQRKPLPQAFLFFLCFFLAGLQNRRVGLGQDLVADLGVGDGAVLLAQVQAQLALVAEAELALFALPTQPEKKKNQQPK